MIYWHISVLCYFRIYLFVLFKLSLSFIWLQGLQVSQNISWSSQDDQRVGEILRKQEFNDCLAWVNTQNSTAWTSHDNFSSPNCVLPLISQTNKKYTWWASVTYSQVLANKTHMVDLESGSTSGTSATKTICFIRCWKGRQLPSAQRYGIILIYDWCPWAKFGSVK